MTDDTDAVSVWTARVARALSIVAATGIFLLMALVFVSVFFRYVLNSPIQATEDMMAILLGVTIFTAFPAVTLGRGHIKVDLLTHGFQKAPRLNRVRLILIDVGIVAMVCFMATRLFDQALRYQKRGTGSALMDWPLYPVVIVFVCLLLLTAVLFGISALRRRKVAPEEDVSL